MKINIKKIILLETFLVLICCIAIFSIGTKQNSEKRIKLAHVVDSIQNNTSEVKEAPIKASETIAEEIDETVWLSDDANFRIGPNTTYKKAGNLKAEDEIKRTGTTYNNWSRVIIQDNTYYIKSSHLTTKNPNPIFSSGTKGEYQKYAQSILKDYGWEESEISPLIELWNRESGWNPSSHNSSSGAHGIPQALPASKMASEGDDYYTNGETQIRWGLGYIKNRYGSPSNAWSHFQSNGWY
jgi:hypothetical protein